MQVAILGAGFCGLATAWNLAKSGTCEITIFDPMGVGKGASGVAAGLLHPYAGARSRKNWRGADGLAATLQLISVAEAHLGFPLTSHKGLLRPVLSPQQQQDFSECAKQYSDVEWRTAEQCKQAVPGASDYPGIFIESAYVVDCENYMKGLWMACQALGVKFKQEAVRSLKDIDTYDHIVVAMGAASNLLPELAHIAITPIKGQVLTLSWPKDKVPLPFPMSSQAYLLMHPRESVCIAGATYERGFGDDKPDVQYAMDNILPKIRAFYPEIDLSTVMTCRAGVRASTANHYPIVANVGKGRWLLSGMGSKGLLYHALCAQELADKIVRH